MLLAQWAAALLMQSALLEIHTGALTRERKYD